MFLSFSVWLCYWFSYVDMWLYLYSIALGFRSIFYSQQSTEWMAKSSLLALLFSFFYSSCMRVGWWEGFHTEAWTSCLPSIRHKNCTRIDTCFISWLSLLVYAILIFYLLSKCWMYIFLLAIHMLHLYSNTFFLQKEVWHSIFTTSNDLVSCITCKMLL